MVVEVFPEAALDRNTLIDVLRAENVLARRYFHPGVHRMEPYRSLYPNAGTFLPVTEALVSRTLILPTGTGVSSDDVDEICNILKLAMEGAAVIRSRQPS